MSTSNRPSRSRHTRTPEGPFPALEAGEGRSADLTVVDPVADVARLVGEHWDAIPWQDAATEAERKALRAAAGEAPDSKVKSKLSGAWLNRILAGPPGEQAGRSVWPIKPGRHSETTEALRGLYFWLTSQPLPQIGPVMGRDLYAGGLFCVDLWRLRSLGLVGDTGMAITGVIGSGKSSCAKTFALRNLVFGRPFIVPADIRGEWVSIVEAVGGDVLRLGPGMPRKLNALAMPKRPAAISEAEWWLTVRTHWEDLLVALVDTIRRSGKPLDEIESTGIEVALDDACQVSIGGGNIDRAKPISLHDIVERLLSPTKSMADEMHMSVPVLTEALRGVGLALRKLTRGSLQGLVDSDGANPLDLDKPATVIDISRVQTSDAAIALVMSCTQAVTELTWMSRPGTQSLHIYDEFWRLAVFGSLVNRLDAGQRISRKTGAGTVLITHRHNDHARGDDFARRAGENLLQNVSTHVYYRQRRDTLQATGAPENVQSLLPKLQTGQAVWLMDERPYVVNHLLAPEHTGEPALIETDQAMKDENRSLASRTEDQLWDESSPRTA